MAAATVAPSSPHRAVAVLLLAAALACHPNVVAAVNPECRCPGNHVSPAGRLAILTSSLLLLII